MYIIAASQQCPEDWQLHNGECFFLSYTAELTEYNWHQANDYCMQNGGQLASVLEQSDQDFIVTMVRCKIKTCVINNNLNQLLLHL